MEKREDPRFVKGLSPRVRGNLSGLRSDSRVGGSIPACAGEPKASSHTPRGYRVYPRVCGGTLRTADLDARQAGLSPRVRGNPA